MHAGRVMMPDVQNLQQLVERREAVIFAYLYGSFLVSDDPGDIDVAIYLDTAVYRAMRLAGTLTLDLVIPLEMEIETTFNMRADVQVLNEAPLAFRHRIFSSGRLLVDRNPDLRENTESMSHVEFFDFQPRHAEYLQGALV